jgi:hypothetical protein
MNNAGKTFVQLTLAGGAPQREPPRYLFFSAGAVSNRFSLNLLDTDGRPIASLLPQHVWNDMSGTS